ncbi:MAG: hypothetical protein LQ352_001524 [Teloschistes flavicans]|nr:MAG: hypothetical protein LQ352_001524 [Teloschistes flavicans]
MSAEKHQQAIAGPTKRKGNPKWAFWRRNKDPYSGKRYFDAGYWYRRPQREYIEKEFQGFPIADDETEYRHRDIYGRVKYQKKDVLQYISPTESSPRPLLVQATLEVMKSQPAGDWRRVKLDGKVPTVLKISEWALKDGNFCLRWLRVILVVPAILILLSLPLDKAWDDIEFDDSYTEFPNYTWDYPKHARNRLDCRPSSERNAENASVHSGTKSSDVSSKIRLLRPRLLVVLENGKWELTSDTSRIPYAFISFTASHFPFRPSKTVTVEKAVSAQQTLEEFAQRKTLEAGLEAYWIDFRCCAPNEERELHTADVHRMCDVIRSAEHVLVLLPELSRQRKLEWGARMWTLPEALLARKQEILFCSPTETTTISKLAMADQVWDDGDASDADHQPTRVLAEHYSSVLTLGRLELFTIALEALANRQQNGTFYRGDIAYALMGLLHNRIQHDQSDSLFQSLAKLSLANDSDRLIERMVCMFPPPMAMAQNPSDLKHQEQENLFLTLTAPDQYHTQLWDIEPLCQVAGVADQDQTLILDACRGVSIRWKAFPQMKYKRSYGFRKLIAEVLLRSGAFWSGLGLGLMIKYAWDFNNKTYSDQPQFGANFPNTEDWSTDVGLIFLGAVAVIFAFLLSLGAPAAVRRLYGGRVMQSAPWLVGFEGVMPAKDLEVLVFGNSDGRLTYDPSSTPFCERDPDERIGVEPLWISSPGKYPRPALPQGHRLFTLVDTGSLTVSIFSARRPPSVALVCGREGGMLRAVLCHYERSDNCLYKETVVRMDSVTLNQAKGLSWVKVGLGDNRGRLG